MRDIQKLCKICLNAGSRDIFDTNIIGNIVSRDELNRIAEKLRFVTLLKVSPKENLPQQICDLCIVQLNVSYNFKRLALKNDFYIRQYMIENGMSLTKEDEDHHHHGVETALEIHQIHNVIRTSNRYRQQQQPAITNITELRRNSTTSSVSGVSMLVNGCDSNLNGNGNVSDNNHIIHPTTRPFVRPIQIKTEPIDPDYVDRTITASTNGTQSSPSSSSNGSVSVMTVNSGSTRRVKTPPMIVINGKLPSDGEKSPAKKAEKSVKKAAAPVRTQEEQPRESKRNLRTIKKPEDPNVNKRKLREAARKMIEMQKKTQNEAKNKKKMDSKKVQVKDNKKLGRPRKHFSQHKQQQQRGKKHRKS